MIKVKGISKHSTDQTLTYFFENNRRSGGGDVKHVHLNPDTGEAIVTFTEPTVVNGVLKKNSEQPFIVDDAKWFVERYEPPPEDTRKVYISGIGGDVDEDALIRYLEDDCQTDVVSEVVFGERPGTAVVTLDTPVDVQDLEERCRRVKMQGCRLNIHCVYTTNCILVRGCYPAVSEESLQLYFENTKKSGGGAVERLTPQGGNAVIVYFKNFNDAKRVCRRPEHLVEGVAVQVSLYYEILGMPKVLVAKQKSQYSGGTSTVLPLPIRIDDIHSTTLYFIRNSRRYRSEFEEEISRNGGQIQWPRNDEEYIDISRRRSERDVNAAEFERNIRSTVDDFMARFKHDTITIPQQTWEEIVPISDQCQFEFSEDLRVLQRRERGLIEFVGTMKAVMGFREQITPAIKKIKDNRREENKITTEKISLKWHQTALLRRTRFEKELVKEFQQMSMMFERGENPDVEIEGKVKDIPRIKTRIYETVNEFVLDQLPLSTLERELLCQNECEAYIRQELTDIGLNIVWDIPRDTYDRTVLNLYGIRQTDLHQAKSIFQAKILEYSIDLDDCKKRIVQTRVWTKEKSQLLKTYYGKMVLDEKADLMVMLATDDIYGDVVECLAEFFNKHSIRDDFVELDDITFRYLYEYGGKSIRALERQFSSTIISVNPERRPTGPGYRVEGTEEGCRAFASRLQELQTSIVCHEHTITSIPGVQLFFSSCGGLDALKAIEDREKCIIAVDLPAQDQQLARGERAVCDLGHRRIVVIEGSLIDANSDAIVVATNPKLELKSELGETLLQKGDIQIQTECEDVIARRGGEDIQKGQVIVTGAGALPFRKLIHAVCPQWEKDTSAQSTRILTKVVELSLQAADENHLTSIAFPALGSETFGFPMKTTTQEIVQGIKTYFRRRGRRRASSLQSITLCDTNLVAIRKFMNALEEAFGSEHVKLYEEGLENEEMLSDEEANESDDSYSNDLEELRLDEENGEPTELVEAEVVVKPIKDSGRVSVSVVTGAFTKWKADVLVNSTSNNLDLSKGFMSKQLSETGGPTLQTECTNNYPNGISHGDLAETTGGTLNCQKVFHGSLPRWEGQDSALKVMEEFVTKCLQTANTAGLTSIAFPALGTGGLKYPSDKVAKLMFDCVYDFQKKNPAPNLKTVDIVIYGRDAEVMKAFRTVQSGHPHSRQFVGFLVDKITVEVEEGDITEETCDVLVSNVMPNCDLDKGGTLSKSILQSAGQSIQTEFAQEAVNMDKQKYVVTSGGSLQCKKIFHIGLGGKSSEKEWVKTIRSCLKEADGMGFTSVSLPALGTGGIGRPPEKAAMAMVSAVKQFCSSGGQQNVTKVRFVIFKTTMFHVFTTAVTAQPPPKPERSRGQDFNEREGKAEEVQFHICCDSIEPLRGAKLRIDELVKKQIEDKTIYPIFGVVKHLKDRQVHKIETMGRKFKVPVKIKKRKGEINLFGMKTNVAEVEGKIQVYLERIETDYRTRKEKARAAAEEAALPTTWTPHAQNEVYKLVPLAPTDVEYTNVSQKSFATAGGGITQANIVSIARIQNPGVYRQYQMKKKQMEKANAGSQFPVERELWHGAKDKSSVDDIISNGLTKSHATSDSVGDGVYFGSAAQTAVTKTSTDPTTGHKYMLYTYVLTGEPCTGSAQMQAPLPKNPSTPLVLHDSATDDVNNPSVFVTFHDSQAYPAFLLTFT